MHDDRGSEASKNMLLFLRESGAALPVLVRRAHRLLEITCQPFFVLRKRREALFQLSKFAGFVRARRRLG